MKQKHPDIDIDVADRDTLLNNIKHIRAWGEKDGIHKVGIYAQNIPYNPRLDTSYLDFSKEAPKYGYFKFDILNNSIYEKVRDDDHLQEMMKEPDWSWFEDRKTLMGLSQLSNHVKLVKDMKPTSVMQLAMVLAMIRPAKKNLVGLSWEEIEKEIWVKPYNGQYYYQMAHAVSYSMSIVVQVNIMKENE